MIKNRELCTIEFGGRSVNDSFVTIARDMVRVVKFSLTVILWINLMCHERSLLETIVHGSTILIEAMEARHLKGKRTRRLIGSEKKFKKFAF